MQKAFAISALLGAAYGQQLVDLQEPKLQQVSDVKMSGNDVNPFEGKTIYANPTFQANVDKTI